MKLDQLVRLAPVTLFLIISFVIVALWQTVAGVSLDSPNSDDLIHFGANFLPLSLTIEPWRIVSSVFLHIGLIHLLFNAFAMYFFGQVAEQILNSLRFFVVFMVSAIGGNLLNLFITWQDVLAGGPVGLSAGASGGIMGLGSALFVLAATKARTPFILSTKNLAMVMGVNVIMGFAVDGIDNAGHIGGLIVGALLGLAFVADLRMIKVRLVSLFWLSAAVLSLGFVGVWWVLQGWVLVLV
ncbi:rhomboid family intramembrane serine protease [Moraxella nasovis]|uniref:rhomboid family intramembrane serine protease n=1 Tax=Moraxella nasovis TaxID=2904121 RepID=UPI001F62531E|nr:rhomboid family intramembrane serine protease [Moraxella nasovis]UNU72984.1 rhomboid family intramembrane serine protease [Moraxella nasovis]